MRNPFGSSSSQITWLPGAYRVGHCNRRLCLTTMVCLLTGSLGQCHNDNVIDSMIIRHCQIRISKHLFQISNLSPSAWRFAESFLGKCVSLTLAI